MRATCAAPAGSTGTSSTRSWRAGSRRSTPPGEETASMCGIAGIVHTDPSHPVSQELLRRMTTAMAHRGPGSDGFYFGRGAGLGHRRLSIIDLSTGDQPIFNEDGTVAVVF